jgi:cytochrome c-type biogenesis protein CcmF
VKAVEGPNYVAAQGDFDLAVDGKFVRKMNPEKRNYHSSAMPMTEASIDAGLLRDVYVSLGEPIDRDKPEANGPCVSITSLSSTGSGVAAC